MPALGVNIDHVATLRQARQTVEPDPLWACVEAELGGADGITFHLRKDRRHINERDARLIREAAGVKVNMEMSLDEEIVVLALEIGPDQATLVPENRREVTTEGGLDVLANAARTAEVTRKLQDAGILVSVFVDAVGRQIHAARDVGADAVEIHTGAYANAFLARQGGRKAMQERDRLLAAVRAGVEVGLQAGMIVHAGHGLTYTNVTPVASIPGFSEFNIGHAIVSRAVFVGLRAAVAEMKRLIERPFAL
ncbi:MAG TPA: pyridoxine 5'-phosphate synthase [Phycisphaerae bacterium]|nr:pyridoxine 5'-phosphate synthase [Phycisphaerae bacterium]